MRFGKHACGVSMRNNGRAGRHARKAFGTKIMGIEPVAANGEEQVPRLERPRVNGVAGGRSGRVFGVASS